MPKLLTIMRGLSGSGKSHYIAKHYPGATPFKWSPEGWSPVVVSADHFWQGDGGEVEFDFSRIGEAHADAHVKLLKAMRAGVDHIILDNTNIRLWEFALARELADLFGYEVRAVTLHDAGLTDEELVERNRHDVPLEVIQKQRRLWEEWRP